jgi:catechol 2,3-dioxygenase-like lactoylglutathione lyase family enzyme
MTADRFHLSLNVSDLARSVAFFELLLGSPPVKRKGDYAKFEPAGWPLVLSMQPSDSPCRGGAINHAGLRVSDSAALVEIQRRLELGGVSTIREDGVECCYAKQTKFWAADPDGNLWEVYVLHEDTAHKGAGRVPLAVTDSPCCGS